MAKQFDYGDKVKTPLGLGIVNYKRMNGSDYSRNAVMYSVILDYRKEDHNYSGTYFSAEQVTEV